MCKYMSNILNLIPKSYYMYVILKNQAIHLHYCTMNIHSFNSLKLIQSLYFQKLNTVRQYNVKWMNNI